MDYSGIGNRIKKYRDAAKMTQQELAEATNYSIQHISHIENGQTNSVLNVFSLLPAPSKYLWISWYVQMFLPPLLFWIRNPDL